MSVYDALPPFSLLENSLWLVTDFGTESYFHGHFIL